MNRTAPANMLTGRHPRWYYSHEFVKFGIVGTFNTVLDFGLANALHVGLHWPALAAKTVSVSMAATSSYFMNRHWTFRGRARTGLGREYSLFFVLNGVGLLIAAACILFIEDVLHRSGPLWFNVAQIAGLTSGVVFRFSTYRRWVFLHPERAVARGTGGRFGRGARGSEVV